MKTSSLDGGKNLKKRVQCKDIDEYFKAQIDKPEDFLKVKGDFTLELPNKDLHSFKGTLRIKNSTFTLSDKQLLLKGANLQNTDWVVAICCYTGRETKIMKNL
jgi:magnesium-transporting ATPase (P-type)